MALYSPHVVLDYMNLHSILNLVNTVKLAETLTTTVLLSFANNVHQMVPIENQQNCILSQNLETCMSEDS